MNLALASITSIIDNKNPAHSNHPWLCLRFFLDTGIIDLLICKKEKNKNEKSQKFKVFFQIPY